MTRLASLHLIHSIRNFQSREHNFWDNELLLIGTLFPLQEPSLWATHLMPASLHLAIPTFWMGPKDFTEQITKPPLQLLTTRSSAGFLMLHAGCTSIVLCRLWFLTTIWFLLWRYKCVFTAYQIHSQSIDFHASHLTATSHHSWLNLPSNLYKSCIRMQFYSTVQLPQKIYGGMAHASVILAEVMKNRLLTATLWPVSKEYFMSIGQHARLRLIKPILFGTVLG